jgi:hypothetical protein
MLRSICSASWPMQDTHELSISGGNQRSIDVPLLHTFHDFREGDMGADSTWPGLHDLVDSRLRGSVKPIVAKVTQDNPGGLQYHTVLLARRLYAGLYVSQAIGEATGSAVPPHAVFCAQDVGVLPFCAGGWSSTVSPGRRALSPPRP